MFGAWQAGAWRALAPNFKPDLIVGASVGSLNGYAIASGWTADDLCNWWMQPGVAGFDHLPETVRKLIAARPLELEYAVVLTDMLRLQPRTFTPPVRPEHLLASCAVPVAARPRRIDGRWYVDGGLLNPLPVWAAVELGATHIIALNVLAEFPSSVLRPFAQAFRWCFGHNPPLPPGVELTTLIPRCLPLGSLHDAISWTPENAARWIEQGAADAGTEIY
jgi:predicted acylesterase/phospholipase RssA